MSEKNKMIYNVGNTGGVYLIDLPNFNILETSNGALGHAVLLGSGLNFLTYFLTVIFGG